MDSEIKEKGVAATDKRKQSLYFPEEMLADIKAEALRQDRSLSWIVQQAWRIARSEIKKLPSINIEGADDGEEE
jgi:uncharacterized small protein (TIGR04563 family)